RRIRSKPEVADRRPEVGEELTTGNEIRPGSGVVRRAPAPDPRPPTSDRRLFALAPRPDRSWTPMQNNGRRNAAEPGTHMTTPAADWSSSAESPARRGTSA